MRRIVACVVAAWIAAGPATAGHVVIPIVVARREGVIEMPNLVGQPAKLGLDILPTPPLAMEGPLQHGQIIAVYSVRVDDAIVLDAPVQASDRLLPAHTPLAKVETTDGGGAPATLWCDVRRRAVFSPLFSVDCLQDDGTGALRRLWTGHLMTWKDSLGVGSAMEDAKRLPPETATPYHKATVKERPTGRIGYAYCDGDGVSGPPRFTTAVAIGADGGWIAGMPYTCTMGLWPNEADHTTVDVDAIRLQVTPGSPPTYKVVQGLTAAHLASMGAGRSLGLAKPRQLSAAGHPATPMPMPTTFRVLQPVGTPSFIASGTVAPDSDLLRFTARHGLTGTLQNSVSYTGLFGGETIPAGHAVYGVPMTNSASGEAGVVWCALDKNGFGFTYSTCFPHDGIAYRWVTVPGPFAQAFLWSANSLRASAPTVKVTFTDLHVPLDVSYRFLKWARGVALIRMTVSAGAKSTSEHTIRVFPADGTWATLATPAVVLRLRLAADGASVEVARATEPQDVLDGAPSQTPPI